jgi:hypothetical protein
LKFVCRVARGAKSGGVGFFSGTARAFQSPAHGCECIKLHIMAYLRFHTVRRRRDHPRCSRNAGPSGWPTPVKVPMCSQPNVYAAYTPAHSARGERERKGRQIKRHSRETPSAPKKIELRTSRKKGWSGTVLPTAACMSHCTRFNAYTAAGPEDLFYE